jgi:hypothetical protein
VTTVVLACDPGMTTGLCLLKLEQVPDDLRFGGPVAITDRLVFSCNAGAVFGLAQFLMEANEGPARVVAAGEAFVHGRGAGARGPGAAATRAVIQELAALPVAWKWRAAGMVKPWATDARLEKAGLLAITAKMVDARDASRHALFAAVHDCGLPDPLGKRARVIAVPDQLSDLA